MDNLAKALRRLDAKTDTATLPKSVRRVIHAARAVVQDHQGDDDDDDDDRLRATALGMSILRTRPFTFIDGQTYPTPMHCFQAQKADPSKRAAFAAASLGDAVDMGRRCTINVQEWDATKVDLMTSILVAQAQDHDDLRETVAAHGHHYVEDTMRGDAFWTANLPVIWQKVQTVLGEVSDAAEASPPKRPRKNSFGTPLYPDPFYVCDPSNPFVLDPSDPTL